MGFFQNLALESYVEGGIAARRYVRTSKNLATCLPNSVT